MFCGLVWLNIQMCGCVFETYSKLLTLQNQYQAITFLLCDGKSWHMKSQITLTFFAAKVHCIFMSNSLSTPALRSLSSFTTFPGFCLLLNICGGFVSLLLNCHSIIVFIFPVEFLMITQKHRNCTMSAPVVQEVCYTCSDMCKRNFNGQLLNPYQQSFFFPSQTPQLAYAPSSHYSYACLILFLNSIKHSASIIANDSEFHNFIMKVSKLS